MREPSKFRGIGLDARCRVIALYGDNERAALELSIEQLRVFASKLNRTADLLEQFQQNGWPRDAAETRLLEELADPAWSVVDKTNSRKGLQ